jgi:hypothetical protein
MPFILVNNNYHLCICISYYGLCNFSHVCCYSIMDPCGNMPLSFLGLSKTEGNINKCKLTLYDSKYSSNLVLAMYITLHFLLH